MKKIFTLFAAASVACAINAQTVETYNCLDAEGTPNAIFVANPDATQKSVADISTASVKAELISGPIANFSDGYEIPLEPVYDNAFGKTQDPGQKNNPWVFKAPSTDQMGFYFVQGKGNPVDITKMAWDEIITDGEPTGKYRANWNESYYQPDGSKGIPNNGTYASFTPSADGELSVLCWINKGNRCTYVVKASDMKALAFGTDVKASGWVHGMSYTAEDGVSEELIGKNKFMENIPTCKELNPETGNANPEFILGAGNQICLAYLTFKAAAGETYMIFNNSAQIGLNSYTFTTEGGAGINNITVDENAPVEYFNLQGIRVANPENGLFIRRQGKNVSKVIL